MMSVKRAFPGFLRRFSPSGRLGGRSIACYGSPAPRPVPRRWTRAPKPKDGALDVKTIQGNGLGIHVRWMIRRDMAEVVGIEREAFEFPWSDEDFTRCLRQRNCIGMVAELADSVVAFMIYELHRSRLHMLNFAVLRSHRRLGIGTQMMDKLIGRLSPERRARIVLEVRETNLAAQLFFRGLGFRAVSVLKDFYQDSTEDAYLMQFCLDAGVEAHPQRRLAG
jgi:ribosomal-protein-alanine N-acetyltransferase